MANMKTAATRHTARNTLQHIQRGTLKGEAAHLLNCMHRMSRKMKHKPVLPFKEIDYTLRYINHIDNNTYRFIISLIIN